MALKLDDKPDELYDDGHPSWQTNIQGLEDAYSGANASDGDLPDGHPSKGSSGKNLSDMENKGATAAPGSNAEQTEKKGLTDALGGGGGGAAGTAASWATNIASKRVPVAWLGANKKKAAAGGGVIGSVIAFFIGSAIITQGPLQLIHAGQMLKGFHWSQNEEFGDERSGNLLFAAKNFLDGNAYRNNLGVVGNKFADTYDKRLAKQGIEFDRGNRRLSQSVTIDRKTDAGRKLEARLAQEGIDVTELDGNKIKVDLTGDGAIKKINILSDGSLDAINRKGKASYVSRKILRLRNGTSWNVLQNKWRVKSQELGDYYKERREKRAKTRKEGSSDLDANKAKAQDLDTDNDGKVDTPDPEAEKAAKAGNEIVDQTVDVDVTTVDGQAKLGDVEKSLMQKLGPAGKVAGGAVAVVGLTCAARSIGEAAEDAQYASNILPMIRMGTDIISIASQVQSGQVNIDEVGSVVNEFFDEAAKPEAKSFFAAKSIQVNQGNPNAGGPDLPEEANPGSLGKKPVVFDVVDKIPGIELACDITDAAGDLPVVKQFGEASNALISSGVESLTGKSTEDFVSMLVNYVAGNGVNVLAQGAELGNLANAGAFLAANENALSMGGRKLTDEEVAELREYDAEVQRRENSQKTFFARMFDLNDAESLLSKNTVQNPNVASVSASTQSFLKAPASLLSNVSSILSPRAHAAATNYNFGVPTYGFSLSERRDARFSDPYESAEKIYDKIDKLNEDYKECFQVKITKDGKFTQEEGVPYTEIPDKCNDTNNEDLLRYRFWIADTMVGKGLSCMDGMDENACTELGFGSTGDTNEAAANASTSNPNLYMIGDSLSIHLREGGSADIVKRFKENGWTDVCVEAEEGRPLGASEMTQSFAEKGEPPIDCRGANNTKTKGLLQINQQPDKDAIAKAGTVVISLGTNDGPSAFTSFRDNVKKMVTDIRAINPAVQIKWINTYTARDVTSGGTYLLKDFAEMNKILGEVSKEMNFEVLDWNSVAAPNYSSDPIHPNPVKYADFILEKVGRPAVNASGVSGVTCPENLEEKADRPGYFKMPDAPGGEYSIYSVPARRYGSKQLVCVLSTVAKAYNTLYAGKSKMDIGDLNANDHSSHYKGIAVDLDAKGELAAADHTASKRGTYDKEATIALGKLLVDTGAIQNIWWCEPGAVGKPKGIAPRPEHLSGNDGTMNAIRDYAKEKGTPITLYCISGHQNHFHVDIKEEFALQGSWKP